MQIMQSIDSPIEELIISYTCYSSHEDQQKQHLDSDLFPKAGMFKLIEKLKPTLISIKFEQISFNPADLGNLFGIIDHDKIQQLTLKNCEIDTHGGKVISQSLKTMSILRSLSLR